MSEFIVRRALCAAAAIGVLAAGTVVITAAPAAAHPVPGDFDAHWCAYNPVGITPTDDGLVTDWVHHYVEPLAPSLHSSTPISNCTIALLPVPLNIALSSVGLSSVGDSISRFLRL